MRRAWPLHRYFLKRARGFQHIQDVWEVADVVYASSCHSRVICLHPLYKVILLSNWPFWGVFEHKMGWFASLTHFNLLCLASSLLLDSVKLKEKHIWKKTSAWFSLFSGFREGWESLSLPGAWWEHMSDRLFFFFFVVKRRQNLEEHKEQIPRNPKPLW